MTIKKKRISQREKIYLKEEEEEEEQCMENDL